MSLISFFFAHHLFGSCLYLEVSFSYLFSIWIFDFLLTLNREALIICSTGPSSLTLALHTISMYL